jgi:hypothetical protein
VLARRTGLSRNRVRCAAFERGADLPARAAGSKLDPFKDEFHRLLNDDPKLIGVELNKPLGFDGRMRIVDEYLPRIMRDARAGRQLASRQCER